MLVVVMGRTEVPLSGDDCSLPSLRKLDDALDRSVTGCMRFMDV